MSVDFDAFLNWAEDRFNHVVVKGNEVKVDSIFTEDKKQHLWCSPRGGKYEREDGVYHCWKTDRRGTLAGLVMLVDGCSYKEAKEILSGLTPIGELEKKLDEYLATQDFSVESLCKNTLRVPNHTHLISSLHSRSIHRMEVEYYLEKRKLPIDGLMYCVDGKYKNRIIIPYYDAQGKLIYFNTRHLNKKSYLGPPKEIGVGKNDVLYCPEWPKKNSKIYLTEGEFDALTLKILGFYAVACGGKILSDTQASMIRDYKICIAVDSDIAGLDGLIGIGKRLVANQISDITYVRPPMGIKDWNEMLIKLNERIIKEWIEKHEKSFDETEMAIAAL